MSSINTFNYYHIVGTETSWMSLVPTPANLDIDMSDYKITDMEDETDPGDAVNTSQMDDVDNANLDRNGSEAMTGNLNVGNNRIINLSDGINNGDAAMMNQFNILSDAMLDRPTDVILSAGISTNVIFERVKFLQIGNLGIIIGEI